MLLHFNQIIMSVVYAVVANATIVWFIVNNIEYSKDLYWIVLVAGWLPTAIVIAGCAKFYESRRSVERIGEYCMELEGKFALLDEGLGWERFIKDKDKTKPMPHISRYVFYAIFILQFLLAVCVGILTTRGGFIS
jgi:hypothetical protein